MSYGLLLVTPPAEEPVSLGEAKNHLRIEPDQTTDDALVQSLIQAAREMVENHTDRALITQTWDLTLRQFPSEGYIALPKPNLQSVTYIKYYDQNGALQTWDSANYILNVGSLPGRICLAPNIIWPTTQYRYNAVTIRFVCGFGGIESVPESVRAAIKLKIGEFYEHRESLTLGGVPNTLPAYDALIAGWRVPGA